jgi:cysteine desulfuration protein SufE
VLSGQSSPDIIHADLGFIDRIGMTSHLAQTRSNGLRAMIKQMKLDATAWQLKASAS